MGDGALVAGDMIDGVLDDRLATVAGVRGAPRNHEPIDLEILILPLRHHGRTHVRVLGSLAPATLPTWIGLRPIEGLDIATFRTLAGAAFDCEASGPVIDRDALGAATRVGPFRVYQGGRLLADQDRAQGQRSFAVFPRV